MSSEAKSFGFAVAASATLHLILLLVIAVLLTVMAGVNPASELVEEEADEMTIVMPDVLKPEEVEEATSQLLQYVRTTQNVGRENPPEDVQFQSDRNTEAASELPPDPNGDRPLPSQEGVDVPVMELADRKYVDGEILEDQTAGTELAAAAAAQAPSEAAETPSETEDDATEDLPKEGLETEEPGEDAEEVAATPPETEPEVASDPLSELPVRKPEIVERPQVREPDLEEGLEIRKPEQIRRARPVVRDQANPLADTRPDSQNSQVGDPSARSANVFQPQTEQNELRGTISNRGKAAVAAEDTPLGRYMRKITSSIEKEWHKKRVAKADFVTYGNIRLKFFVNNQGKVEDLRIVGPGGANAVMQDFSLSAVLEANIPPMPRNIIDLIDDARLPVTYDIVIY